MRVEIKRDKCIGSAACVTIAPGVFDLDGEMKAIVKDKESNPQQGPVDYQELAADDATILEAAQACPTLAIHIYDDADKQIFPPPAAA